MRTLSLLLTGLLATTFAVLLLTYALLDTAPKPWDEAYLLSLPTRLNQVDGDVSTLVTTYYQTRIFKPPLSMIGTALSMGLFGDDAIGYMVDNLLVALLAAFLAAVFLARFIDRTLAAALAACLMVSPFALNFGRVELAELYLWAVTLLFFGFVTSYQPLRSNRGMVLLGGIGGIGIATKLSFPLIAGPLAVWHLVGELRRASREDRVRQVLWRSLGAVAICVLVVATLCGENWRHMWRNLKRQFGSVADEFGGTDERLNLAFLERYAFDWAEFVGWFWIGLAVLALAGVVFVRATRRDSSTIPRGRAPVAALLFTMFVNLGYCYFHPVVDVRFTIGAIAAFTLLVGLGVGTVTRGRPQLAAGVGVVLLLPNFAFLLSNSFVPAGHGAPLLDLQAPVIGRLVRVLPAPCRDADLRERALLETGVSAPTTSRHADAVDAVAHKTSPTAPTGDTNSRRYRVGLAGDHRSLNLDNLRLFALRRQVDLEFVQIGYFDRELTMAERRAKAGTIDGWVILVATDESSGAAWQRGGPTSDALAADAAFERSPWTDRFADGTTVHVFRRRRPTPTEGK